MKKKNDTPVSSTNKIDCHKDGLNIQGGERILQKTPLLINFMTGDSDKKTV
jgi:hypothetical protein